jgi:site-specific recombinase XerD
MKTTYYRNLDDFLSALKNEMNYSDDTIKTYKDRITPFLDWVKENRSYRHAKQITKYDLREFLATKPDHASTTTNLIISSCKSMWKWMQEEDIVLVNVTDGVRRPRNKKTTVKFMTVEEAMAFIKAAENYPVEKEVTRVRVELMAKMLLLTGIRRSELQNIKNDDIQGDVLKIRSGKGNKEANVTLHDAILECLERYQRLKKENGFKSEYLFVANGDKPISDDTVWSNTKKLFIEVGRPDLSTHKTRSTYAVTKLMDGEDLLTVMSLLRHVSPETTMRYAKAIDSKLIAANKKSILVGGNNGI